MINKKCSICKIDKSIEDYNIAKSTLDGLNSRCKSCYNKNQRDRYDPEKAKSRVYAWRIKNLGDKAKEREEKYELIRKEKELKKYKKEILTPIKKSIRTSLWLSFKNKGFYKNGSSENIIGCDYLFLKSHIEKQFLKGMKWENKELWHIDHIVPLSIAKTKDELYMLCHYSNIQPLWAFDNYSKRGKVLAVTNLFFNKTYLPRNI